MKRTRKVLNLPLIKSDGDNKLLEGHAPCLCDAPQKFEVLAAQLEPLMLPAAVYPPPGNATMRTSTHPAPHPTPSFLWLFFFILFILSTPDSFSLTPLLTSGGSSTKNCGHRRLEFVVLGAGV